MIFCTIAAENYLPKALHLGIGVRRHHPNAKLFLCVPERTVHPVLEGHGVFDLVCRAADLAHDDFARFAFRHEVLELSTAIKARVLLSAFAVFPEESEIIYLDPDVSIYGPFDEATACLRTADILVTPHHLAPIPPKHMVPLLRAGAFNLGFLGVRRTSTGEAFLHWFMDTLETMCYADASSAGFVDQKWMDLASSFFPVTVLREVGYNVAHWNFMRRPISVLNGCWKAGGDPLRFFHFSGIDLGRDQRFFLKWAPDTNEAVHVLRSDYKKSITALQHTNRFASTWSYDTFLSGETIATAARHAARLDPSLLKDCADPFAESNEYVLSRATAP